jgi:hypothetical protein
MEETMKKVTLITTLFTLSTAFAGSALADPGHQTRGSYHSHGHHAPHAQDLTTKLTDTMSPILRTSFVFTFRSETMDRKR